MLEIGTRKLYATCCTAGGILVLSFAGLLLGKIDGAGFLSAVNATCFLVGGFMGLNVTGKVFGKNGEPS
jgi:hypothetical protein